MQNKTFWLELLDGLKGDWFRKMYSMVKIYTVTFDN